MKIGWMRFWGVFGQPWPIMIGFALAEAASRVLWFILMAIIKAML